MSERFFVGQPISGDRAKLAGDEARHLATVMRVQLGDRIVLFDGSGAEFLAEVAALRKQAVELTVVERREISREAPREVTLAVALPKGERQKWLVEKATELGAARLVPLMAERGVAEPTPSALDRLRRTVIEASKQCGRNLLMEIAPPAAAIDYLATAGGARYVADPAGRPVARIALGADAAVAIAVGPEGGFTAAELDAADFAGWQRVSLGRAILRVETAAIAGAAWATGLLAGR
jgi:16S rRNA (uracil1498-N3)-methyltransferase